MTTQFKASGRYIEGHAATDKDASWFELCAHCGQTVGKHIDTDGSLKSEGGHGHEVWCAHPGPEVIEAREVERRVYRRTLAQTRRRADFAMRNAYLQGHVEEAWGAWGSRTLTEVVEPEDVARDRKHYEETRALPALPFVSDYRNFQQALRAMLVKPQGIGDIASDAKGSGARFNAGKPPFDLLPLSMVALSFPGDASPARTVLERLGAFQSTHDAMHLEQAVRALGLDAWPEAAQVFEYGRAKYAAWNWAKGMPWSVPLACAARHLWAMLRGEDTDPESGKPHRGHVLCNLAMLLTYTATYKEGNDLPAPGRLAV